MPKKEKIAANVVTYNRKDLLRECLNSLLAQTRKPNSIIIVDNNSTDGTKEMVEKEFLDNPIFDYVRLNENTGSAGGQYTGIKRAYEKGFDWVWCMDDDATPKKQCLKNLLVSKESCKKAKVLVPVKISINGNEQGSHVGVFSSPFLRIKPANRSSKLIEFSSFVGPLFSKDVIREIGLPNKDLFIWHDDYEYFLRIKTAGFKTYLVDSAVVIHNDDYGRQKKKQLGWKNYYGWRNKFYIKKKYCKPFWFYLYLVVFLLWQTSEIIFVYHQPKYIETLSKALLNGLNGKLGFIGFDI
ncbi:MAG: glycosyltransferase family 2 protein [Patescibacteria group bacterium]|jgi:rhamnopyranosyl-N-acetylglucosaminyl-diphospho-decaprenol beta-1,3/1,4-galactofuranosyltransferase